MPKSILVSRPKTVMFHCRISEALHTRLRTVQSKLKVMGGGAVFPVEQIVEDALERATRLAETELARSAPPQAH